VLSRARATFDEALVRPLGRRAADRPVVIVPSVSLRSLPWSIVPSYANRSVVVSPSAMLWQLAAKRPAPESARTVVVAGPGLPGALEEAAAVADMYPGCLRLFGDNATAAGLSAAMDGAALVHLAAHGLLRSDNPLFSALIIADGPFTIYDLERLRHAPCVVVLAACDTGRTHTVAGDEMLGFAAALLAGGTTTLVAPVMPVPDAETAPLMQSFHRYLGARLSPPEALAKAQAEMWADDPATGSSGATFVCLGAGQAHLAAGAAAPLPWREEAILAPATASSSR
jgi:CHAT domain-containing protein